jgi:hypothetical protein
VRGRLALAVVLLASCNPTPSPPSSPHSSGSAQREQDEPISIGSLISARNEQDQAITLRIDRVERDRSDAEIVLYQVSLQTPDGQWKDYCLPDAAGHTTAIALAGGWDAADHHIASDAITFACTNGALAKCVRWGYKPWKSVGGVSLADYHQACVHLVRADYCGNGTPHTRDGTTINVYDELAIQKRDTRNGMVFEAAWGPSGAVYLNAPRLGGKAADIAAECPERLGDRTPRDAAPLSEAEILARWPEALIFTESYAGNAP